MAMKKPGLDLSSNNFVAIATIVAILGGIAALIPFAYQRDVAALQDKTAYQFKVQDEKQKSQDGEIENLKTQLNNRFLHTNETTDKQHEQDQRDIDSLRKEDQQLNFKVGYLNGELDAERRK